MAKQNSDSTGSTRSFDHDLVEDKNDFHLPSNSWSQARNAINNSKTGDLGKLGNEPANLLCASAPYKIIGVVHLEADIWTIFSTDNINSEIGVYTESKCGQPDAYVTVVNDPCLRFNQQFLIKGVSKIVAECTYKVYWDDGLNVSRVMKVSSTDPANSGVPWVQSCTTVNNCVICTNTTQLDCDKIRLARLVDNPCFHIAKGPSAGTLPNGSYMVSMAYAIKGQKVSDWHISNVQPLFNHENTACSLDVIIDSMDETFSEFICVIISTVNQQTVARQTGIYSTRQKKLSFDIIDNAWPTVPIEQIPIQTPIENKSDAMYTVGDYLIRTGPTYKEDFNYQPRANQIVAKWSAVEYDTNFYIKGGSNTGYMRDEVYPFFIRWVFDTGDKSLAYHIPGRPPLLTEINGLPYNQLVGAEALSDEITGSFNFNWLVNNLATITTGLSNPLPDGGIEVADGFMGYWESTELYPDDKQNVWNPSFPGYPWNAVINQPYPSLNGSPDYDLCGQPIRHHRFPDNYINGLDNANHFNQNANKIRIMGVKFENILPPVDNLGNPIAGIRGYEILRGTRNGNKTIIAKGVINNMGLYNIEGGVTPRQGAYPNYPYNDLNADAFISDTPTSYNASSLWNSSGGENGYVPQSNFSRSLFTFHSPDTNIVNPFLSAKEVKIYEELNGEVTGQFIKSEKHPKEKLITNMAFLLSTIAGIAASSLAMNGQRRTNYIAPRIPGYSQMGWEVTGAGGNIVTAPIPGGPGASPDLITALIDLGIVGAAETFAKTAYDAAVGAGSNLAENLIGIASNAKLSAWGLYRDAIKLAADTQFTYAGAVDDTQQDDGAIRNLPPVLAVTNSLPMFFHYFTIGTDAAIDLIRSMVGYIDYALRYQSHCLYTNSVRPRDRRRSIDQQEYVGPQITDFASGIRINNLYRSKTVAVQISGTFNDPSTPELTRIRASEVDQLYDADNFTVLTGTTVLKDPTKHPFNTNNTYGAHGINPARSSGNWQIASSHYVALKQRIRNQYGQITGVKMVPASSCVVNFDFNLPTSSTGIMFGGDIYIGRYTEKNTFFHFYDWLYNEPNGTGMDYQAHRMLPHPRYWANFNKFETSDFTTSIPGGILGAISSGSGGTFITPEKYYNLDGLISGGSILTAYLNIRLSVKNAWFYLFSSGVRDFFVESETNIDLRDWGITDTEQFYQPYGFNDLKTLFDTSIIKAGNYYKYDQSLSISKTFMNYVSWGQPQQVEYFPDLAETCYIYKPKRVIYSLPTQLEDLGDNWLMFLPNNYKDFLAKVTTIKPINKNGALIFFDTMSPVQFQGTDQLQTDLGTKLTIGDGGLFSQPLQNLINADRPYEYGSCQDRLSAVNTPMGVFWISQNQGKIFNLHSGIDEITMTDLKWWFAQYLPYKLTQQFPNFQLVDNPVIGIGCQSIYDNENQLVYFTKRDFIVRTDLPPDTLITYIGGNLFCVSNSFNPPNPIGTCNGGLIIELGDPNYFEDASWTVSYDPKLRAWVSWHDWHPNLMMPGKNTFMTIQDNSIWVHNFVCNQYCNYYGVDYPFEVEFKVNAPEQVTTLRNVEYFMEAYKYDDNCHDRFHDLDYNFDEATVYNTEQCSGLLKLNLAPKNNPAGQLLFPQINPTDISILFHKVEQKYRFNQFWDITDDRGEFNPSAQRMIWNTAANGYVRVLNPNNLNYNKASFERKKFRHYTISVLLRKKISGDRKLLVMLANTKQLNSPR